MPSLIPELKKEVLDQNVSVSALLRKALIIAKEIHDEENESWISSELKGYSDRDGIPQYRMLRGRPIVRNHYTGWQYVYTQNLSDEQTESISTFKFESPIAVFESNAQQDTVAITYHPKAERMLIEALGGEPSIPAIQFQGIQFQEVLATVRNRLLEWISNIPDPPELKQEQPPAESTILPSYAPAGLRSFLKENKVWLFQGAGTEVLKWLGAILLATATFFGGYYFPKEQTPLPTSLTSEELKSRVDQITQAHNQRRQKLLEAVIKEEHHATEPLTSTYEIRQTLSNLRKELEKEDVTYQKELKLLTSLGKQ